MDRHIGQEQAPIRCPPRIAIPMGDPAGVGPEIVVKAIHDKRIYEHAIPIVIGDARSLASAPGWPEKPLITRISNVTQASREPGNLSLIDLQNVSPLLPLSAPSIEGGKTAMQYLAKSVDLALSGHVQAVASAPLNKEAMRMAGFDYSEGCEYLAQLCGGAEYSILTVSPTFTLGSVTTHVPMSEVPRRITREKVLNTIRHSAKAAKAKGIAHPRIGVAALNPHGGEGGTIGREEIESIRPAVQAAREEGIDAHGPFPADTFYMTVKQPAYDVYVGMYHDQGRIAIKLLDFGHVVTLAEGLPFIYCTVGHGTAFDIAGKGIATADNMIDAILLAASRASLHP